MLVAFWDQVVGNSTFSCLNAGPPSAWGSPMIASLHSHSSWSYGCTPAVENRRSMTRPFSVVLAALEVALAINSLLSLGFRGEHRSILGAPDGTEPQLLPCLRGFS